MPSHPATTDTRQRLIDAAGELFWERGYAATGLSDILTGAGTRGGSLYHFFPTKDDLLLAVIDRQARVIENAVENALAARDEPRDKVLGVVEFYRGFMQRTNCTLGCPLTNLAGEIADTHPLAARRIAAFFERVVQVLAENIALLPDHPAEPTQTARAILATIQGAVLQSRVLRSNTPMDVCKAAIESLLGPAARARPAEVVVRTSTFAAV